MALSYSSLKAFYLPHFELLNIIKFSALGGNAKSEVFEKRMLTKILEPNKDEVPLYDELRVLKRSLFSSVVIVLLGY